MENYQTPCARENERFRYENINFRINLYERLFGSKKFIIENRLGEENIVEKQSVRRKNKQIYAITMSKKEIQNTLKCFLADWICIRLRSLFVDVYSLFCAAAFAARKYFKVIQNIHNSLYTYYYHDKITEKCLFECYIRWQQQ